MKVILVAEAWGRREAQFQHALVGPSGRELTLQMGIAGLAPFMTMPCRKCERETRFITSACEHCRAYIWPNEFNLIAHWRRLRAHYDIAVANVFNAQPPNNDLGYFFGTEQQTPMPAWRASKTAGGSHLKREYFFHVENLWRELNTLRPNLIVALGNASCWAILGQTKISALRGTVNWSDKLGIKVLPTFHPANILRPTGRSMRPIVLADLKKAALEAEFPEVRRPERFILVPDPTPSGLNEICEWLQRPAAAYTNDIETFRGQITITSFARSRSDVLVFPFRLPPPQRKDFTRSEDFTNALHLHEPNYWPTPELELAAWKLVIEALERPQPKIFQNGLYDLSYYLRMGIQPRNCFHDTMLWHHSEYPELPKSLGFLGSLYSNDIAWKQIRRRESLKKDE